MFVLLRKAFFWENIRTFLILELEWSIFSEHKKSSRSGVFFFFFQASAQKFHFPKYKKLFRVSVSWNTRKYKKTFNIRARKFHFLNYKEYFLGWSFFLFCDYGLKHFKILFIHVAHTIFPAENSQHTWSDL